MPKVDDSVEKSISQPAVRIDAGDARAVRRVVEPPWAMLSPFRSAHVSVAEVKKFGS